MTPERLLAVVTAMLRGNRDGATRDLLVRSMARRGAGSTLRRAKQKVLVMLDTVLDHARFKRETRIDPASGTEETVFVLSRAFLETAAAAAASSSSGTRCWITGERRARVGGFVLLGGGFEPGSMTELLRRVLPLVMCENTFRSRVLGQSDYVSCGVAVAPRWMGSAKSRNRVSTKSKKKRPRQPLPAVPKSHVQREAAIRKLGTLKKKAIRRLLGVAWKPKWVVATDLRHPELVYYDKKDFHDRGDAPKRGISLIGATISYWPKDRMASKRLFTFRVANGKDEFVFAAETDKECKAWVAELNSIKR